MNVLLITMSMKIGGAETHVLELAKGLNKRGYTIYVMSNGGDYVEELESNNIEHINAPIHNRNIKNIIKSYKILEQTIINKKIDIVHAHARIPAMVANAVCNKLKVPMVTTAHGVYKVNTVLKVLTKWGKRSIAVSNDVKEYLINEYQVNEKDISITVNGIDMEKFSENVDFSSILDEFKLDNNTKKVVHVSRLDSETSIVASFLIDMAEEFENTQFIIVGNGSEFNELKRKADRINEKVGTKRVVMPGGRTDINKFDAISDVFIGVSRAALEAMSAGKSVIMAGNQGYYGIFDESKLDKALETNFCFRGMEIPKYDNLKRDILELLDNSEEKTKQMGDYNRKIVDKYYSLDRMVDDAINMYKSV